MKTNYNGTIRACMTGYIVQAIVNSFAPLLFVTFGREFGISMQKITMLVTINFGLQLIIDLCSAGFIDKIGYRISTIAAHFFAAAGIILMTILPQVMPDPFIGLVIAVMIYAVGGGLIEVLISPMVEACPTEHKEKTMSLLHSFYCWGCVAVVLISTVFFSIFEISNWRILALIWSLLPIINAFVFMKVPIRSLGSEDEEGMTVIGLLKSKIFWIFAILMLCAGASEQAVSQWASAFAEKGLNVEKSIGDLAGPMFFSVMMGLSRTIYGRFGHKIDFNRFMLGSTLLCILSYLVISISPIPALSLLGCGICGFSVGIMWPGVYSKSAEKIKNGGTAMFALLALAGDLGCSGGPAVVGFVSGHFNDSLKIGIFAAIIFPIVFFVSMLKIKGNK